jgi:ergothioneine biosynthesis protein EgtB
MPHPDTSSQVLEVEAGEADSLLERYARVRRFSEQIAAPLSPEDSAIQSMEDASPTRWHLAHTTWFFETFLLKSTPGYCVFDSRFEYLFNSYYNTVGEQYPRSKRGLISRPGLEETLAYREHTDRAIERCLECGLFDAAQQQVLTVGLNHEQQHQELMSTDIKHALSRNPLDPVYCDSQVESTRGDGDGADGWVSIEEGMTRIGYAGDAFSFDNETPRHRIFLEPYRVALRTVTNGEFLEFIEDGGYQRPELWLSMGWSTVQESGWQAPLYWRRDNGRWTTFTLSGRRDIDLDAPVCHVSYFEADAFARWAGARLPTEFEWEHAIASHCRLARDDDASFCGHWSDRLLAKDQFVHPRAEKADADIDVFVNAVGNVWEWTASQYLAYPGYQPPPGALGEYNGKFMCNQFVLRGGSCATPSGHARLTYRNFFPPDARWQFSGIRLATSR